MRLSDICLTALSQPELCTPDTRRDASFLFAPLSPEAEGAKGVKRKRDPEDEDDDDDEEDDD